MTITLLVLIAASVLIGAWCPQESAVGRDKVVEQFGPAVAEQLIRYGIADIFHTPWFLGLIGLLTVNMVACSVQRVFPKVRSLRTPMAFLGINEIRKLPVVEQRAFVASSASRSTATRGAEINSGTVTCLAQPESAMSAFAAVLKRAGYSVSLKGNRLTGHWGLVGRLAATVTHIGLLLLMAGVTITSWTGFGGFQPVDLGATMSFIDSEHSKLWVGKLPQWQVRVDATRKETYESGDPKQWYSTLSVIAPDGRVLKTSEISVNNPLTYEGVDIYQSSWGLRQIIISFNKHKYHLDLRQMGPRVNAAFLPLDDHTIMLFSVRGEDQPVRVFAKVPEWKQPRILTLLQRGKPQKLGAVEVCYEGLVPTTGLQYKCDPGLPITYVAFGLIMIGVMLAAVPHRQVWACAQTLDDGAVMLVAGGMSRKAKTMFERGLNKLIEKFIVANSLQTIDLQTDKENEAPPSQVEEAVKKEEEPCQICS